jgi:hypothetical protein
MVLDVSTGLLTSNIYWHFVTVSHITPVNYTSSFSSSSVSTSWRNKLWILSLYSFFRTWSISIPRPSTLFLNTSIHYQIFYISVRDQLPLPYIFQEKSQFVHFIT